MIPSPRSLANHTWFETKNKNNMQKRRKNCTLLNRTYLYGSYKANTKKVIYFPFFILQCFFEFSLRNGFGHPLVPLQAEPKSRLSSVQLGATMGNHYSRSKVNFGVILIPVSNCQLFELHYSYTNWPWIKQGYSPLPLSTSWVPRFWLAIKVAGTINRIVNILWPFHLEANEKLIYFISSCRWAIQ